MVAMEELKGECTNQRMKNECGERMCVMLRMHGCVNEPMNKSMNECNDVSIN